MRYISIGSKCNVKSQIDRHVGKNETHLFDWLGTDMESVIQILQCDDINNIFNHDNVVNDVKVPNTRSNSRVIIKNLSYCVSIHDLRLHYKKKDVDDFIDKYKRRFERLIQLICGTEKIHFIRHGKITEEQKELFINTILKINPSCNFSLVSVTEGSDYEINKSERFIEFKITNNTKKNQDDWTSSYLDWGKVFTTLSRET
jgi:hypothetical protein